MTPLLFVALFTTYVYYVEGQSPCTTPSGGVGTCKSLYQCDALLHLVNKNDRTPDDIHVLHKSQCGLQGTAPSLCCPETCYTPDNQPGRCVSIFTCPHLLNLLRLPVSQETMQYLQYSRCQDSKQFSVCCGLTPNQSLIPITVPIATNQLPGVPAAKPTTIRPLTTSTIASDASTDGSFVSRVVNEMTKTKINESTCLTPSGEVSTCKSILECGALLRLITKPNRTLQETDLLKRSQCGYFESQPAVCCPEQCYTPDGQLGKCTSINSCPQLTRLLTPPVSDESIQYIRNSRCDSSDVYSVCCGSPPNLSSPPKGNCAAKVSAFPPDPRSECCGVDARVKDEPVAPGITNIHQYPWLAMIEYINGEKTIRLCTGALISGLYVVTAGHCVIGDILRVGTPSNIRLGEFDTGNAGPDCILKDSSIMSCTEGTLVIPIEQTIPHPDYNPYERSRRNDIGLIRMQATVPFTDFIRPICLPQRDLTLSPPNNWTLYAAGWGYVRKGERNSQLKLHVDLPYVRMEICRTHYDKLDVLLWHKQLCAGGVIGKDACQGDTGGPLMYQNGRSFEIIGVISFGRSGCGRGIPGVFTNVYSYNTWIRRTIKP